MAGRSALCPPDKYVTLQPIWMHIVHVVADQCWSGV